MQVKKEKNKKRKKKHKKRFTSMAPNGSKWLQMNGLKLLKMTPNCLKQLEMAKKSHTLFFSKMPKGAKKVF